MAGGGVAGGGKEGVVGYVGAEEGAGVAGLMLECVMTMFRQNAGYYRWGAGLTYPHDHSVEIELYWSSGLHGRENDCTFVKDFTWLRFVSLAQDHCVLQEMALPFRELMVEHWEPSEGLAPHSLDLSA